MYWAMVGVSNTYSISPVVRYIFIGIILVNALGLCNVIFTADSALYASIAKRFLISGDLLNIYVDGKDWLDKPHFPFWVSAFSMYALGVSDFAYKLPSLLFFFISLFYTYRFTKEIYGKEVAWWAILILSSALHIIISNNDVRAEGYLLGSTMGGLYHFYKLRVQYRWKHLWLGALYVAIGIMTKGIFIAIIPGVAILGEALLKKEYHTLFKLRWLWAVVLIVLFITPELYALYNQFDIHLEKRVFDRVGVSGLWFFFVESQFDRFRNVGYITQESGGSIFFFFHTLLWAFAPWAILLYASIILMAQKIIKRRKVKAYYPFTVSVTMLLLFSTSGFQLPHYTNIIMPFFSILVAEFLLQSSFKKKLALIKASFWLQFIIFIALSCVITFVFQPEIFMFFFLFLFLWLGVTYFIYLLKIEAIKRFFYISCLISLFMGIYLNLLFYPKLLSYQAEVQAAKYANTHFPDSKVIIPTYARLFEFYIKKYDLDRYSLSDITRESIGDEAIFYARNSELDYFTAKGIRYEKIKTFKDFHITKLTMDFLNNNTRENTLKEAYLIKIYATKNTLPPLQQ